MSKNSDSNGEEQKEERKVVEDKRSIKDPVPLKSMVESRRMQVNDKHSSMSSNVEFTI